MALGMWSLEGKTRNYYCLGSTLTALMRLMWSSKVTQQIHWRLGDSQSDHSSYSLNLLTPGWGRGEGKRYEIWRQSQTEAQAGWEI